MRRPTTRTLAGLTFLLASSAWVPSGAKTDSSRGAAEPSFGAFSLTSKKEPIQITADKLEFDYKAKQVVFRDQVEVVQGEVHLQSDVLTVNYAQVGDKQQLEMATADGHVVITQGTKKATGRHAVFDQKTRTVVLTGDAVLEEGSNQVSGDKIVVHPDDSRMEVLGQNRRVKVILFPGQGPLAEGGSGEGSTTGSATSAARVTPPGTKANGAAQSP
jgi:lipopolysaccharide export system protein LptA